MGLFLNSNSASLSVQRRLFDTNLALNSSLERLSSGLKITGAEDGAGQLALSSNLKADIRGVVAAQSNVQQGVGVLDIADAALQQIASELEKVKELAVQAGSDTATAEDIAIINAEIDAIETTINGIAADATFNGSSLLGGTPAATFNIVIDEDANTLNLGTGGIAAFADSTVNGLVGAANFTNIVAATSAANAATVIGEVETALGALATNLGNVGGAKNRLSAILTGLQVKQESLSSAEASISNVDIATETATLTRLQVTQQAGAFALSTANQIPSVALSLLR